jgi:predicted  nucleic acid-binding Zn-ribbon protein
MQGSFPPKGENQRVTSPDLVRVECLGCGRDYAKPADDRTMLANPGCPECGYVGWIPVSREGEFDRSDEDRQLRPVDRTG